MEMSEFLNRGEKEEMLTAAKEQAEEELDVQKAVVESLAADKAEQNERIVELQKENEELKAQLAVVQPQFDGLKAQNAALNNEVLKLKEKIDEMSASLAKVGDVLAQNSETECSSKIALLDRDPELNDRFAGETRDHVLEVIREARDAAEKAGRIRRAQILESVLVANESVGNLSKKRAALEKFFNDNGNILSGPVIAELEKCGISHKNGETYLLPAEILKRTY